MIRRIVLLRPKEWLKDGWSKRSFGAAGVALTQQVGVKGLEFSPELPPIRAFGKSPTYLAKVPGVVNYSGLGAAWKQSSSPYAVVGMFDDEEAIQRLKQDRQQEVIGVFADPQINVCPGGYCSSAASGDFKDVIKAIGADKLKASKITGKNIRVVIVDTGIDGTHPGPSGENLQNNISATFKPVSGYKSGSAKSDHGTMVAFDCLLAAPDAVLYDYPLLKGDGKSWQSFLSDALSAFANLMDLLQKQPGPLVVNNSWALYNRSTDAPVGTPENYSANPNHPFNQVVGSLVSAGADVVFAAGNCGQDCPDGRCGTDDTGPGQSIHGANSHPSVITVAAVTVKKQWLGYSSQGPGGLAKEKPDLSGYSQFLGSGVYTADGGTSAACPVVSGTVAALRQAWPKASPDAVKAALEKNAQPLGSGWSYNTGSGVVDAYRTWSAGIAGFAAAAVLAKKAPRKKKKVTRGKDWIHQPLAPKKKAEQIKKLKSRAKK
jgi:subtilisin family serine protease